MNPLWTGIHRLPWCTMIGVISGHRSWSGTSRKNATLYGYLPCNSGTRLRWKQKQLAEKSTFSSSQLVQWPFVKKMYFVAILDSGPQCYECTDPENFEECAVGRCLFNYGKCYYSAKQQDPFIYKKYGCIQPQYCDQIVDGNEIHCCEGSLCNKGL